MLEPTTDGPHLSRRGKLSLQMVWHGNFSGYRPQAVWKVGESMRARTLASAWCVSPTLVKVPRSTTRGLILEFVFSVSQRLQTLRVISTGRASL
jgi:hypothetical protein